MGKVGKEVLDDSRARRMWSAPVIRAWLLIMIPRLDPRRFVKNTFGPGRVVEILRVLYMVPDSFLLCHCFLAMLLDHHELNIFALSCYFIMMCLSLHLLTMNWIPETVSQIKLLPLYTVASIRYCVWVMGKLSKAYVWSLKVNNKLWRKLLGSHFLFFFFFFICTCL